jgi:hypothetical protein
MPTSNLITSNDVYYAWIPTNTGILSFSLMGKNPLIKNSNIKNRNNQIKELELENLDLSFISDTKSIIKDHKFTFLLPHFYLEDEIEISGYANINLKFNKNKEMYEGTIKVFYNNTLCITSEYEFEENGKLKLLNISYSKFFKPMTGQNIEDKDIAQILFVLIKFIVHGDAHHHQKVDTLTFVMPSQFDCFEILDNFIDYFKRIQVDIKNSNIKAKCKNLLKLKNIPYEIQGYLSYINTFITLFCSNQEKEQEKEHKTKILLNLEQSIKSKVETIINKQHFSNTTIGYGLVISGILLSINIFLINFFEFDKVKITYASFLTIDLILIAAIIIFVGKQQLYCRLISKFFYENYATYEYLEFLSALSNKKAKRLRRKDYIIRYILAKKQAILFLILTLFSFTMYYILFTKN